MWQPFGTGLIAGVSPAEHRAGMIATEVRAARSTLLRADRNMPHFFSLNNGILIQIDISYLAWAV